MWINVFMPFGHSMYFYFVNSWYENGGKKMAVAASLEQNANVTLSCKQVHHSATEFVEHC